MKAQKEESAQRCLRLIMSKYIDRAALFNSLSNAKTVEEIFAAIQAAPAEDVEPVKRGRWDNWFCSVCGAEALTEWNDTGGEYAFTKFCPNCGAKMEDW